MGWIIKFDGPDPLGEADELLWNDAEGWVDGDNYDTFSDEERETLTLPIGGVWEQVPWNKENI